MTRIYEVLVSLLIVFLLIVVVGVLLPSHGHIERLIEVSSPPRQIFDSLETFRRFPSWSVLRKMDPRVQMNLDGPESGPGAKVTWSGDANVGQGSLTITSADQDSQVKMALDNGWSGSDKTYTIDLKPAANGKTVKITWIYDVDYGWNLLWRYAGLYINGEPASEIQVNLANISQMLATFPNVDYKDQKIELVDVTARPILLVSTKAKRTLDDIADATDKAMTAIEAVLKKTGLHAAGPRMTITTNWGDEDYTFDVAVPVDSATFTLDKQSMTIAAPTPEQAAGTATGEGEQTAVALKPGDHDDNGYLVVDSSVRGTVWYSGKALEADYTGSPAALPLLRLMLKAYAETHGYAYSEADQGRFWDEMTPVADAAEGQQAYKVYLPVQL